jgi:hypothetical protein
VVKTTVLLTIYYLDDQIKKIKMGRACGKCGRQETCIQGRVVEILWKKPLARPRYRWEENVKMGLEEVG